MGELGLILFVIFTIVRGLYLFFRWAVRGLTRLGAPGATFTPQDMPPQGQAPPQRMPLQPQRPAMPQYQPAPLDPRATSQFAPVRRTDAGGPAVSREATTESFRAEEEQLLRSEPQRASTTGQNGVPVTSLSDTPLFITSSDFLRAFILQEALGPPLSRRPRQ